jgi:peptidoglycan/xylan/chitin deacetylase (PgdA/CDA1 family)
MRKLERLIYWFARRNPRYIALRVVSLFKRYGLTPSKAEKRVLECVDLLARYDSAPTFPTPGRVVAQNAAFCRELQARGVELAVHGYEHVDFTGLAPEEARQQFEKADGAFECAGIQFAGFRCPYLSYTDSLLDTLPPDAFRYSSNKAIVWNVVPPEALEQATTVFQELSEFYHAEPAAVRVAMPHRVRDLVEIPASLPDDIQINDGLKLGAEGIQRVWMDIFEQVYRRGELFTILFHPELYEQCAPAFESILQQARQRRPAVWVTQLRDVGDWWQEKAAFSVRVSDGVLQFDCSPRATILLRNVETAMPTHRWNEDYRVLEGRTLPLRDGQLPLLGIAEDMPLETCTFLSEQGYFLATGDQARCCAVYLDRERASDLNQVQLVECVEGFSAPLARYWRWPNEKKSALCITGDLDTVSLLDYATRLFTI